MIGRRTFVGGIASGVLVWPLGAFAQQQSKVWRIGFFYFGSRQSALDTGRYSAFVQGMRELGYVEGKNVIFETRFGDGKVERLPNLAAELVQSKVDVIVATGSPVYSALRHATNTVPIIVTVTADPVVEGLAASLARPGGNITGLSDMAANLGPKQLELLMAAMPQLSRVGVLLNPDNVSHPAQITRLMLAAQKVGVQVVLAEASTVAEIELGFAALERERANAVILFGDTFFVQQFQQIAQAALKHRVASIYLIHEYAEAGGLMSYGPNIVDSFRRAATYVDKILKGAKPGELPFEQAARYSLAINLKTAKALGLTIPQSLLLRADEVIQ
ncbi:MAG TPA: ABC transporter substrate-binding protein [Casimicrobiaceae bacterium]|nr:ABC transporter substrate-binding protein [Casimicrobiaceae bacterium]